MESNVKMGYGFSLPVLQIVFLTTDENNYLLNTF